MTQNIKIDLDSILQHPARYARLCSRHNLTPEQFDDLLIAQHPEMERYKNYSKSYLIQYGVYPVPSSIVKLEVMAQDAGIPKTLAGLCAERTGTATEILDMLRVGYFKVFSEVLFERNHFYREFRIKKPGAFLDAMEKHNGDFSAACKELKIDFKLAYKKMVDETTAKYHEMHKPKKGKKQEPLDDSLDTSVEEDTYDS